MEHKSLLDIDYTGQPVPELSNSSVDFILNKIYRDRFPFIVEYGSGGSTRFFLKKIFQNDITCRFISVEFSSQWFSKVCEMIKDDFGNISITEEKKEFYPWDRKKINNYLKGENQTIFDVPGDMLRLEKGKNRLKGGRWGKIKYLLGKNKKPKDGFFSIKIGNYINFLYFLKNEFIKDQYGESPLKYDYINAGLDPIKLELAKSNNPVKVLFMIDGGPRGDIVNEILNLEEANHNFFPTILLFDAQRAFYKKIIDRRPQGNFISGSNFTLKGEQIYHEIKDEKKKELWGDMTAGEMAAKEIWFYEKIIDNI